jgi:uncharacterized surface protein with fasciclin (FAS1) repeats
MPKRTYVLTLVLILLALLGIAPAVLAQFTPDIFTVDQPVVDGQVNITRLTSNGPGWVVIHADDGGQPGAVLGYAATPGGISANLKVPVTTAGLTDAVFAMLHTDGGAEGVYEFPDGADAPVSVNDRIVMHPFAITGVETTAAGLLAGDPEFATLAAAVEAAGLGEALAGEGPFTLFAPDNAAFAALPADDLAALLAAPEQLAQVLLYHVSEGQALTSADIAEGELPTMQGAPLAVTIVEGAVKVNAATVTTADLTVANGVIHVIDQVLLPPAEEAATAAPEEEAAAAEPANLVETASASGQFPTLLAAIESAGLGEALAGEGPFTLFAPSEDAFAALPAGALDALLADPEALADVLTYHVIAGAVQAADIANGMNAATLEGKPLTFALNGGLTVNGAHVVASDLLASNGVIHVIDQVLLPPAVDEQAAGAAIAATAIPAPSPTGDTIAAVAGGLEGFATLLKAAEAAGLTDDLAAAGPFTIFAPTDDAFAKLPAGTLDALLADEAALQNVLLYHVILNRYTAAELAAAGIETAAQGNLLVFTTLGDTVRVNGVPLAQADVEASNGIVHVIDTVLLPPQRPTPEAATDAPATEAVATEAETVAAAAATEAPTNTPVPPTATNTPVPTNTPTPVPPTATNTPVPTNTPTPVPPTATNTPVPTNTPTPVPPTATNTPVPTNTPTPVPPTATNTPKPPTSTPLPTATNTPTPLPPTSTPLPTATNTLAPTSTPLPVTEEATAAPTEEATAEATVEPSEEATAAPAEEATAVVEEATAEATAAPTEEATAAPAEEATAVVEEATAEATAAPTEEVTAEPTEADAESTAAPDAVATETPGDLPSTGLDLASGGTTLPVVAVVLAALVIGGFVTRRRDV